MSMSDTAAQAAIDAARELHLPTVRDEAARLAEIALRERQTCLAFLIAAEIDERAPAAAPDALQRPDSPA